MTDVPCAMPIGYGATCPLPTDHPEPCPVRCKCSHSPSAHGTDRRGCNVCWSAACGCAIYRPEVAK